MTSIEMRFWDKVRIGDGCWLWTATKSAGYGMLKVGPRMRLAHRLAWSFKYGEPSDGLCVLHNCPGGDNPSCVRSSHMFLGTQVDNIADRDAKGRRFVKLTREDVARIRELASTGLAQRVVAGQFGISQQTVSDIVLGRIWRNHA